MKRFCAGFMLLVVLSLLPACGTEETDTFATTGTVAYISLEGGFFGIKGDDGRNYDPVNLAAELQKDGLRIRFEAKELTNRGSVHMWGRIIEIVRIEKL